MDKAIQAAQDNLRHASKRYKAHFDRKARPRTVIKGEKVLLLLPAKHNKLELKWQEPFEVIEVVGSNNYVVNLGAAQKTYHANLLKRYFDRETSVPAQCGVLQAAVAAIVDENDPSDPEAEGEREMSLEPSASRLRSKETKMDN
ncbi:reverse transcriptase [Elysia marginata]|uniref:Reverse transcriptase n=1 Tax=Elysia marginata TaxID=1093978 RepID=A0AAV4H210_9GAST|nr:reverse transcriptase [Elysia marginata]